MAPGDRISDDPYDASEREPRQFADGSHSVLTPMGQVESLGAFARGLGARRLKVALAVGGALTLLIALLSALA